MAFAASDGKRFTNKPPMMAHERSAARNAGGAKVAERNDPLEQPAGDGGSEDGSQVAQEHGPAQEVHMMHDHEGGMHHVHSMHPDGHTHQSEHGSVEEAHEHAKKLAGGGMEHEDHDGMDEAEYE